jgi:hypothetical protein
MAVFSSSRRSAAGISFIVAGALILLGVILGVAAIGGGSWLTVLAYLAIAVGFAILAIGSIANVIARIALIVAAIGWALLAFSAAGVGAPAEVLSIAALLAAIGGVIGAIVLYTGREITDRSAVAFIVTTILAAIILLLPALLAPLGVLVPILLGIGFIITGVLFHWVQRGRRR